MRKTWLWLLALVVLPCVSWAKNVTIVLKDGTVVKGKLLATGEKGYLVQTANGKERYCKAADVEELFEKDADVPASKGTLKPSTEKAKVVEESEAPAPAAPPAAPARRVVKPREPLGPRPFKPGLSFGMDFTTGSRAGNNRLTTLWKQSVPEEGWEYLKMPLTDIGLELLYKPHPMVGFGVFGQWFIIALGNNQQLEYNSTLYWYGYPIASYQDHFTFDLSLGMVTYGGMVRVRPSPNSRVAFAFYAGQASLAGATYTVVSENNGTVVDQTFSGKAPYFRGDLEFALVPDTTRVVPVVSVGYQSCKMKDIQTEMTEPFTDSGTWVDNAGRPMELDYSSVRIGLKIVGKF